MAEKSGELNNLSIEDTKEGENLLEIPEQNRSLSETDDYDVDVVETDDAHQIREQIKDTRSQMSETIDAIQEKLSVANITEQVKDQVSEQLNSAVESAKDVFYDKAAGAAKTIGKGFARIGNSDLAKTTRKNPWVLSVIGMGIGAVLIGALTNNQKSNRKKSRRYEKLDVPQTRQKFDSDASEDLLFQTPETIKRDGKTEQSRKTDSTLSGVSNAASAVYKEVNRAAGKNYRAVGKASAYSYEKAGDLGSGITENYQHYKEENPLAVGAVALAVGAAIGYAIPLTKIENEYFGEVRDKIADKVQASAQDAIGTVKQTVGEARQIIAEEVKSKTASK